MTLTVTTVEGGDTTIEVKVGLSPEKLADLFWEMNCHKQAAFFNRLALVAPPAKLCMQLQWVNDSELLTHGARSAMGTIGEYSHR